MDSFVNGKQVILDNEIFYKIENFDCMTDFFMTITSSSDVWNFCWAQGGITAGRKNSDNAIFPYYTSDKVSDEKVSTGAFTVIKITKEDGRTVIWQPFASLLSNNIDKYTHNINIKRNIYKNSNGSKVWFEETNAKEGISFRYGWTSSQKYGLVKLCRIENLSNSKLSLQILDGCRNIMSANCPSDFQNAKSVLMDAYKKSEIDSTGTLALFTLSSVVTDKAEPSESLLTNVSYFTTDDKILLSQNAIKDYLSKDKNSLLQDSTFVNGKRPDCFILHEVELGKNEADSWEQVLDVNYDISKLKELQTQTKDKTAFRQILKQDIESTDKKLEESIALCDGIQQSSNNMTNLHHFNNVMFNTMRGGYFYDDTNINLCDFTDFAQTRNKDIAQALKELIEKEFSNQKKTNYNDLKEKITKTDNKQLERLFLEYLPLTFSRRHGDPSRPWNKFNIDTTDKDGNAKLYYEGNWRDIFQNWEALVWSYPVYAQNICCKFLNAMTIEGFNPYRITRDGIDWEVPDKDDPWAQYGYWTDHQVVYFQRLLEFFYNFDKESLFTLLNTQVFSSSNIPYRLKSYALICKDAKSSIAFDYKLDKELKAKEAEYGTDIKLVLDENEKVQLSTMTTKLVQLLLAKLLNHVPNAGIWMNTQRPEWNDANNALAGYGTSIVTTCQLYRLIELLIEIFSECDKDLTISKTVHKCLTDCYEIYQQLDKTETTNTFIKEFTDKAGLLFEQERDELYANGFGKENDFIKSCDLISYLKLFAKCLKNTILANKRSDGLYNSYNIIEIGKNEIEIQNLKLMLEGQVAVLSSKILTEEQTLELSEKLRESPLFEQNQYSYMLYPNTTLKNFEEKNIITKEQISGLESILETTDILKKDINGLYHFNSAFKNAEIMKDYIKGLKESVKISESEMKLLKDLYENTFNHKTFTGRSGTFYAYEGLGCIYWHMVSKLLLSVAENLKSRKDKLYDFYEDVKKGLGYSKTPEQYGAFPADPYSHTPYKDGAKQPGMTGQVKEEILVRWRELGLRIKDRKAYFETSLFNKKELLDDGTMKFSWCGTQIVYSSKKSKGISIFYEDGSKIDTDKNFLTEEQSFDLFNRTKKIKLIEVSI